MNVGNGDCLALKSRTQARAERRHFDILLVVPPDCGDDFEMIRSEYLARCLDDALSAEQSGSARLAASGDVSAWPSPVDRVRNLVQALPRYGIVQVSHPTGTSLVLHTAPAIIVSRFFGKKVVLEYRDNPFEAVPERARALLVWLMGLCDRVVVPSRFLRQALAEYGIAADMLGEVVECAAFAPRVVSSVQPRIVVGGPLDNAANVGSALRAFRLVKQKYPRAEMTVLGDGPARQALERLVAMESILGVAFVGRTDRAEGVRLFAEADVYLNSSLADPIPGSLLWALSAGLPIVTADTGGAMEIIRDGVNGLLVRANNPGGMADSIIRLVETPELAATLSLQARLTAEKHSPESVKEQWLDFYANLWR